MQKLSSLKEQRMLPMHWELIIAKSEQICQLRPYYLINAKCFEFGFTLFIYKIFQSLDWGITQPACRLCAGGNFVPPLGFACNFSARPKYYCLVRITTAEDIYSIARLA
jgi:hypothetical protein